MLTRRAGGLGTTCLCRLFGAILCSGVNTAGCDVAPTDAGRACDPGAPDCDSGRVCIDRPASQFERSGYSCEQPCSDDDNCPKIWCGVYFSTQQLVCAEDGYCEAQYQCE